MLVRMRKIYEHALDYTVLAKHICKVSRRTDLKSASAAWLDSHSKRRVSETVVVSNRLCLCALEAA